MSPVQNRSPAGEGSHDGEGLRYPIGRFREDPQPSPWATLPDTRAAPPEASLSLLQGLHARWVAVLRTLDETALQRKLHHPEDGMLTVSRIIQSYAWHGRHHHAHIANLRSRKGW